MASESNPAILPSILSAIGSTPLIRLDRLSSQAGLKCNLLAKCEFFNAGGSVKDRIAKRMVEEAEAEGRLRRGSVVIEPTSGNTGVGLALQCAVKGYRCIIVMPEKMSLEKANTLAALGAEVIRTPTGAAWDSPESLISVAKRLEQRIEGGVILDQYANENNPLAHYHGTGTEIVEALAADAAPPSKPTTSTLSTTASSVVSGVAALLSSTSASPPTPPLTPPPPSSSRSHPTTGVVDVLFAGTGTGGTITGLSRRIKESNPHAIIVGVDPYGSILAQPSSLNALPEGQTSTSYLVEGIGYDFVPQALDRSTVDEWMKSSDGPSFEMTRRLIRTEGLLCGGSSGAAVEAALRWLKSPEGWEKVGGKEGMNAVVILPDSLRNYVTKPWLLEGTKDSAQHEELMRLAAV